MSDFVWTSGAEDDWNNAAYWSEGTLPNDPTAEVANSDHRSAVIVSGGMIDAPSGRQNIETNAWLKNKTYPGDLDISGGAQLNISGSLAAETADVARGRINAGANADFGVEANTAKQSSILCGDKSGPPLAPSMHQVSRSELVFEFTRDPSLLQQYYRIREEQSRLVHNVSAYSIEETEWDRRSHIIVVRNDDICVGGASIFAKEPHNEDLLPLEHDGFRLAEHFPDLDIRQTRYGQISGFVVIPELRKSDAVRRLFIQLHRKLLALELNMVFMTAPLSNARIYLRNCIALGLNDLTIHKNISCPDNVPYPDKGKVKPYLVSGMVKKVEMNA